MGNKWDNCLICSHSSWLGRGWISSLSLTCDVSFSDNIEPYTGRCLWVPRIQGGTSQVKFCQSEHAALMTTCITPPWCHRNSAPLKLERLGTLTTPQSPRSLALCPRFQKQYVLLVAKTNRISLQHSCRFVWSISWVQSRCSDSAVHSLSVTSPSHTCCQTRAVKCVNMSGVRDRFTTLKIGNVNITHSLSTLVYSLYTIAIG